MAGTAITSFLTELSYYVKNADDAANQTFMVDNMLKTLRDFCKKTWIWREVLDKISVVDGTSSYTLTPGTDNSDSPEVYMVDWVKYKEDGADDDQFSYLTPINLETWEVDGSTGMSAGYVNTESSNPREFYIDPDDSLNILPIPDDVAAGTENMQVKCILNPALDATTVPPHIYNDWLEPIAKGCAGRILKLSGKKWYNPQLGQLYWAEYLAVRNREARAQRFEGKNRSKNYPILARAFTGGNRGQNWY